MSGDSSIISSGPCKGKKKERQIKEVYNRVFSDDSIKIEQLETSLWFDGAGNKEGLEW
jgi:hypothetical protein